VSVSTEEIDAAFKVVAEEVRWSINKLPTVRRMLEAAERVRITKKDYKVAQ
jgi:hypothetical protein